MGVRPHKSGEGLLYERSTRHPEQVGCGQIGLPDQALLAQRAVANRRHVIKIEITRSRTVELGHCFSQFLVLHLKLNLVYLQIVQYLHGLRRLGLDESLSGCYRSPVNRFGALLQGLRRCRLVGVDILR